jgi:hypothetical protein
MQGFGAFATRRRMGDLMFECRLSSSSRFMGVSRPSLFLPGNVMNSGARNGMMTLHF